MSREKGSPATGWYGDNLQRDLSLVTIIPTIDGREELYALTVESIREAYAALRLEGYRLKVCNQPTIGDAWRAGLEDTEDDVDFVFFAADDILITPEGLAEAIRAAGIDNVLPCPRILNTDGKSEHSTGTMGGGSLLKGVTERFFCATSPFPLVSKSATLALPPIPSIHYYADDWMAWCLGYIGIRAQYRPSFELTHLEGEVPNRLVREAQQHRLRALSSFNQFIRDTEGQ